MFTTNANKYYAPLCCGCSRDPLDPSLVLGLINPWWKEFFGRTNCPVLETRPIFSDQDQDQDQMYNTKIKTKTETARPRPLHPDEY